MPLLTQSLQRAFAGGMTVVTPNRRLARSLVTLFDREERAAGRAAWPAAKALPWDAWLQTLWQEALAAGVVPPGAWLRTLPQATHTWNRIAGEQEPLLIDRRGVAEIAADAWSLIHGWGAGGESWRAWAGGGDDCAAFADWANRYAHELQDAGAIDVAQFPDRFCGWATAMPSLRNAGIVFAGFMEFTPQQKRLLTAIAAAGATITFQETLPVAPGRISRARGGDPRDEMARALTWARTRVLASPEATIAIVVEDLAARRAEVCALADEILCPALQWPGVECAPRPYNLSLGAPLLEAPPVTAALDLLDWVERPLPIGRAAALLRSPWIAPDAWLRSAWLEADWLGEGRRTISMRGAIAALAGVDRAMAQQWTDALDRHRMPASGSPRSHVDAWRAWLAATGWPGAHAQDSVVHQALGAWDNALAAFATLGTVDARMSRMDARAALRAQLASTVFQPETPPASIQVVGLLEAAGQPFDALWIAGLVADRWPPAPRPNPLLPVDWQRERNVPRASAARELAYARLLTLQFARAAPEVVFSHAGSEDDHACTPSLLLPGGPDVDEREVAVPAGTAQTQFSRRPSRECAPDDFAPPLAAGANLRGGAGLVEAQSDCPFKAVAKYRLGADPWPEPIDGLSPMERGTLVHAALAAFWRNVETHDRLCAMHPDALASAVTAAAAIAVDHVAGALSRERWRAVAPIVAIGEVARLEAVITDWIASFELARPPFAVSGVEASLLLQLGGLSLRLRLDRVDALMGGGVAIIDYKTGRVEGAGTWFAPRPLAPQLGLYTLAHRTAHPEQSIRAVAYAQLKPGELAVRGLAADADAWPVLKLPSMLQGAELPDWRAAESRWSEILGRLAAEIVAGAAAVSPRDPTKTCARCKRQPLCRIGALAIEVRDQDGDE